MIIERQELEGAKALLTYAKKSLKDPHFAAIGSAEFFAHNPHLLFPLGFNEYRIVLDPEYEKHLYEDRGALRVEFGSSPTSWSPEGMLREYMHLPRKSSAEFGASDFLLESYYRDESTGAWFWFDGIDLDRELRLVFRGPGGVTRSHVARDWLRALRQVVESPPPRPHSLYLPKLWTPSAQLEQLALTQAVPSLLEGIQQEKRSLRQIPWRQLEEIVAELLRSRGLEIFVTPRSRDGGRDILARGELILGEPTVLAVEVKQKQVVGLADLQRTIKANEDFPALLLATAGRFSAGVIQERNRNRHQLRIFLKDGIALRQWIDTYVQSRQHST